MSETQLAILGYARDGSKLTPEQESKADLKESQLQATCEAYLRAHKIWYLHLSDNRGSRGNRIGVHDLLMCINGCLITAELKVKKRKASVEQRMEYRNVVASGGASYLIRSFREFRTIIDYLRNNVFAKWSDSDAPGNGW